MNWHNKEISMYYSTPNFLKAIFLPYAQNFLYAYKPNLAFKFNTQGPEIELEQYGLERSFSSRRNRNLRIRSRTGTARFKSISNQRTDLHLRVGCTEGVFDAQVLWVPQSIGKSAR